MRLLLHVPLARGSTRGNWITALRWTKILSDLGHTVRTVDPSEYASVVHKSYDALIALHARRSADAIELFRIAAPRSQVIVALTGTDLHIDLTGHGADYRSVTNSLAVADHIVLLEPEGLKQLEPSLRSKCVVIYQSTEIPKLSRQSHAACFKISLLAHLRAVKDPFLIIRAVELLPSSSKATVIHAGEATSPEWRNEAVRWTQRCPRYEWVGALPHLNAMQLLANSHVTVLTSRHEGAPSVFSEAARQGIPMLSTRIPASVGILGPSHPGLFEIDDALDLAKLIDKAETNKKFYHELCGASAALEHRLSPQAEQNAWNALVNRVARGQEPTSLRSGKPPA